MLRWMTTPATDSKTCDDILEFLIILIREFTTPWSAILSCLDTSS